MKRKLLFFIMLVSGFAFGQKQISIDDIYGKGSFYQKGVYGINWMNDGRFYSANQKGDIVKFDVTTGEQVATIVKASELSESIRIQSYSFSSDEKKVLLMTKREGIYRRSYKAEYYVYDLGSKKLQKLSANGAQSYATFSPDATKVAFARENNLFYVNLSDMSETQVTTDGKWNHIINGSTDWVYEEEFSFAKAFEWSGDGKNLAYFKFDESAVKEYNMQRWEQGKLYPDDYKFKYPKAGEGNATVAILIYNLSAKKNTKVDIGSEKDIYIPRINWTQDNNILSVRRMSRLQNEMDILHVDAKTGQSKVVLNEKSDTYVDLDYCDDLTYLNDGKHFIHSSEKDGFKHLYLYTVEGKLVRQITKGNWEVTRFIGINEQSKRKTLYYISTENSSMERDFYSISLDGSKKTRHSMEDGNTSVNMSRDFKYYIKNYSNATTPRMVSLHATKKHSKIKDLETNEGLKGAIKEYNLQPKTFMTIKGADGTDLNAYMIKPADFDSKKKYPVLIYQYSGPGSQNVFNAWGGSNYYWHQMLTQKGYIVAVIDPRGTGGKGEKFKKMTYKQLGRLEVEDQIASAKYLGSLDYVDASRIGIWGWSFGGYMSSLAILEGADVFKTAIAVAPVTTWRYYDTIYTERFLQRPQDNASGYDDNSPVKHVDKLKGNYFLIHGTGDDNVHFQNAVAMQDALIAAGKQFDSFYYPDRAHGIYTRAARPHLYNMMTNYILEKL